MKFLRTHLWHAAWLVLLLGLVATPATLVASSLGLTGQGATCHTTSIRPDGSAPLFNDCADISAGLVSTYQPGED